MTTTVKISVEQTNCPTGMMIVSVGTGSNLSSEMVAPPFERTHYVHGNVKVSVREANEEDVKERQ